MRRLLPEQIEELTSLYHKSYQSNEALGIHFKAARITSQEVESAVESLPIFTSLEGDKIISTLAVRLPWSENPSPFALPHLGWIATDPDYQGKNLAKGLIEEVVQNYIAKELKAPAVTLGTAAEHPWLIRAYEKMGFSYFGERRLFPDHKTVYMIKILNLTALKRLKDSDLQDLLKENIYEF